MSSHKVEIIRVRSVEPHPNADRLELVKVWGYTAIVKKGDFKVGDLAVYVEPDYIVPDTEPFSFLKGHLRIKARKLRGVWSQGLLMPLSVLERFPGERNTVHEGKDVMEILGVVRYEPPVRGTSRVSGGKLGAADKERGLKSFGPWVKYELENLRRHADLIEPGEVVYVTEKIHGTNARFRYAAGRMWCGSRSGWKSWKPAKCSQGTELRFALHCFLLSLLPFLGRWFKTPNYGTSVWWRVLQQQPWIEDLCRKLPGFELHGEIYGDVQDLKYGHGQGELSFAVFDVKRPEGRMLTPPELGVFAAATRAQMVPSYGDMLFDMEKLEELSRINLSNAARAGVSQIGEGIVVATIDGRVKLKLVSDLYLERS